MYEIIEINSGVETLHYATTDRTKAKQQLSRRQNVRLRVDGRIYTLYEAECFLSGVKPKPYVPREKKKPGRRGKSGNAREIERVDAGGNVVARYDSIVAAAIAENIEPCSMGNRIRRGVANGKGESFRYAE